MEMSPAAKKIKRERNAEYLKEWRRKNPGKMRMYNMNYWEKQARLAAEAEKENK